MGAAAREEEGTVKVDTPATAESVQEATTDAAGEASKAPEDTATPGTTAEELAKERIAQSPTSPQAQPTSPTAVAPTSPAGPAPTSPTAQAAPTSPAAQAAPGASETEAHKTPGASETEDARTQHPKAEADADQQP